MESKSFESGIIESSEEDVLSDLAARHEELRIVIHDLEVCRPTIVVSFVALVVSLIFLAGAIVFFATLYLDGRFSEPVSTLTVFLAAILAILSYSVFRRFLADYEQRHLYQNLIKRAIYLEKAATDLLESVKDDEPSSKGA